MLVACFVGISILGMVISIFWRVMINLSGIVAPLLCGFGILLVLASEATTQTGIFLILGAITCVIGFLSVGGAESDPGMSTGGSFILLISMVILALVYDFYGFSSIEFLIVSLAVFFTAIGETIFSTTN